MRCKSIESFSSIDQARTSLARIKEVSPPPTSTHLVRVSGECASLVQSIPNIPFSESISSSLTSPPRNAGITEKIPSGCGEGSVPALRSRRGNLFLVFCFVEQIVTGKCALQMMTFCCHGGYDRNVSFGHKPAQNRAADKFAESKRKKSRKNATLMQQSQMFLECRKRRVSFRLRV